MISLALAIPHTPWIPARVESVRRLREELGYMASGSLYREFTDREPNYVWSARMWTWGAETDATHFLTLQDDAIVAPHFWPALRAMIEAVPDQVIGLEVVHRAAPALAAQGHRFFTTTDCLIGVGYVLPTELLRAFFEWRSTALNEGAIEAITEDTLLAIWCMVTGHRIWHPLPTIIDHDTTLESNYGNDSHQNRRPLVRWDTHPECPLEHAQNWCQGPAPVHLGRFYQATPGLAAKWVKDYGPEDYARHMRDDGQRAMKAIGRDRARRLPAPDKRIFLAVPCRDRPYPAHSASIAALLYCPDLEVDASRVEWDRLQHRNMDLVRTRSILARQFLQETDCTHMLFVDSDVSFPPEAVRGMLATGKDFVATPYPSRDSVHFERAASAGPLAEAAAYDYAVHMLDGDGFEIHHDGTTEIKHIGLGLTLLSRACLEQITSTCGDIVFIDRSSGPAIRTVAPFKNLHEGDEWWSEDFSFCERWRRMGGKVWMYLGPGSPATHHGDHAYQGRIEFFGVRRT